MDPSEECAGRKNMASGCLRRMARSKPGRTMMDLLLKNHEVARERCLLRQLFPVHQRGFHASSSLRTNNGVDEEQWKSNPYYEKYADKIKKAQTEGYTAPQSQSKDRLSQQLDVEKAQWKRRIEELEKKLEGGEKNSFAKGSGLPKSLSDILKMDAIEGKSAEEISEIWLEYFKGKDAVSAVIPADTYDRIYSRALTCPTFIYPLPKLQGYEIVLAQFSDHQCFFTSLVNYQAHGDEAPWQMNIAHYTDFKESKGIVLMTSEVDLKTLSILEAQCLAQLLQMFYATADEERFYHVRTFNHDPHKFKYMDVVKEVECSGLQLPILSK